MNIKLQKIKEIFSFNNTSSQSKSIIHGQYPHVVQDKIYWQSRLDNSLVSVEYATIENNNVVMSKEGPVLTKSLACQNFRVFYDDNPATPFDEKWKAIGGYHVGRGSIKITNPTEEQISNSPLHQELTGCKVSKSARIRTLQDVVWKSETKLLFTDDYSHPRHANGFYVFKSKDGVKWETYHP
ncbi:MAG TPA: hypothetical protein DCM40_46180, partial [Maribacter sp.]|nr:hypothetical protein [Maribacter sp.]